jgi:hypothetical protein
MRSGQRIHTLDHHSIPQVQEGNAAIRQLALSAESCSACLTHETSLTPDEIEHIGDQFPIL